MHNINIDLETYSDVNISSSGMYKYVMSPNFQILLFGYSVDGAPSQTIDLASGETIPQVILKILTDSDFLKHAYNAAFEWFCLSKYLFNLDEKLTVNWLSQWHDTMLEGLYCGYPAGLDALGKAMDLPQDKKKLATGKALIRTFCVPCKPTKSNGNRTRTLPHHEPEKWDLFKTYNLQDVTAEQEMQNRLCYFPVPEEVWEEWRADLRMNFRGVAVDMEMVIGAIECSEIITEDLTRESKQLTGLDNPNSVAQLKGWIEAKTGNPINTLNKENVSDLLKTETNPDVLRALSIRQELSKTSVKKYTAMQECVCGDNRVRGILQFYGANRTGRWAGRLVQVQNLPRTYIGALPVARELVKKRDINTLHFIYGSVPDTLSQLIRTALVAAPGNDFIDADFSAIEARVVAWVAGEDWVLNVFKSDGKIYEATASQMFGVDKNKIKKGNPEYALRQKGKIATLALGYGGGTGALIAMGALKQGLTEEELPDIVKRWRSSNKRIRELWYKVENVAIDCIRTGKPQTVGCLAFSMECERSTNQWFLTITLPSGRKLYYVKPHLIPGEYGDSILYYGMDQTSHTWVELETWGGKLVENCVQAIARDCLAVNLKRLEDAGHKVVFHVHDEVIIDRHLLDDPDTELNHIINIMSQPISWAEGLPLGADGWVGKFYRKD